MFSNIRPDLWQLRPETASICSLQTAATTSFDSSSMERSQCSRQAEWRDMLMGAQFRTVQQSDRSLGRHTRTIWLCLWLSLWLLLLLLDNQPMDHSICQ